MTNSKADIVQEYGPFEGVTGVHGVTYDGESVWFCSGDRLNAVDPGSGQVKRTLDVTSNAGTAFDGKHLFQIAKDDSGMAWAEGSLWVGEYRARKIRQVDPETGKVLRTIESNRFVTGVTWVDGELWHGTWENEASELRHVDPDTGKVLDSVEMPAGVFVSGLESDGKDRFYCGGGPSGKVRAVRPKRA
jgi:glutamine cyclotransferase